MKLAIHTISDDNNFGNRLQNYALQKVLNSRYGETQTLQEFNRRRNYYSLINDIKVSKAIIPVRVLKSYLNKSQKISLSISVSAKEHLEISPKYMFQNLRIKILMIK